MMRMKHRELVREGRGKFGCLVWLVIRFVFLVGRVEGKGRGVSRTGLFDF